MKADFGDYHAYPDYMKPMAERRPSEIEDPYITACARSRLVNWILAGLLVLVMAFLGVAI